MKIGLSILVIILLLGVVYLTWENRDSSSLTYKVLSFFTVGLLSMIITVFLQDKKPDINYKTTTVQFIDKDEYPVIFTQHIEENKDRITLDVLTSLEKIDLNNKLYDREVSDYQFDLMGRIFIAFLENLFMKSWYIDYDYNQLTGGTTWGSKGKVEMDFINIDKINIFKNPNFKFKVAGTSKDGFYVPKGTKISYFYDDYEKHIIFNHKYFTYKIELSFNSFRQGFSKYENLFYGLEGRTYYYDIKTTCKFSEWFPYNPMVKKYEDWVNNTNHLIDFYFNSYKNLQEYDISKERRRLVTGGYK